MIYQPYFVKNQENFVGEINILFKNEDKII